MDAAQTASDLIEASQYLILATADETGRPWSSPVYRATADAHWIVAKDGQPDHRVPVTLP